MVMNMSFPVIDLQKFPDEEEYKKLREACEEWGSFRVMNHSVPLKLMEEMKKVAKSLLDLPIEIKKRNVHVTKGSGYTAIPLNPIYENLGFHDVASSFALNNFFSQLDASIHQREIIKAYVEAIHELAADIGVKLKECASASSSSGAMDDFKEWRCQFKVNKFNFNTQTVGLPGINVHTDPGFVTVLQEDELVGGLEIMNPSSDSFVEVPPIFGTFVINLGDVAHAWSNGRFRTAKHRVMCKEGRTRISIVTSIFGPRDRDVEAAKEFVDCDHPRLFMPFYFEDYMETRWSTDLRAGQALDLLRFRPSTTH